MNLTRARRFVRIATAAAAAGTIITPISMHARRDDEANKPIRHVVVIFQENVSYDHYFATYPFASGADGSPFTAQPGTPLGNGLFELRHVVKGRRIVLLHGIRNKGRAIPSRDLATAWERMRDWQKRDET